MDTLGSKLMRHNVGTSHGQNSFYVAWRIFAKIFVPVIEVLPPQQVTQISAGLNLLNLLQEQEIFHTNFQSHTKQNCQKNATWP